jgi:hypothetical protein
LSNARKPSPPSPPASQTSAPKHSRRRVDLLAPLRRIEDAIFRVAAEAEYRLRIVPRGTRIVPSTFDRRIVRLFLLVLPLLVASLFIQDRTFRIRLLLLAFVAVVLLVGGIFLADARAGMRTPRKR